MESFSQYQFNLLERTEDTDSLGKKYIEEKLFSEKKTDDAYHAAIASVYFMDVIISWNFKHIVKLKTIQGVPAVNRLFGYNDITICSPKEVLGDVEGE